MGYRPWGYGGMLWPAADRLLLGYGGMPWPDGPDSRYTALRSRRLLRTTSSAIWYENSRGPATTCGVRKPIGRSPNRRPTIWLPHLLATAMTPAQVQIRSVLHLTLYSRRVDHCPLFPILPTAACAGRCTAMHHTAGASEAPEPSPSTCSARGAASTHRRPARR
jgi:hypothetical protein